MEESSFQPDGKIPFLNYLLGDWFNALGMVNTTSRHTEENVHPTLRANCDQSPLLCKKMRKKSSQVKLHKSRKKMKSFLVLAVTPWIMEKNGETNKHVPFQAPFWLLCPSARIIHILCIIPLWSKWIPASWVEQTLPEREIVLCIYGSWVQIALGFQCHVGLTISPNSFEKFYFCIVVPFCLPFGALVL